MMIELLSMTLSGLLWTLAYILLLRQGLRDKTYSIPAFALMLNITWEVLYLAGGIANWSDYGTYIHTQTVISAIWLVVDAAIFILFLRYGQGELKISSRAKFSLLVVAGIVGAALFQIAILAIFPPEQAAYMSAFLQNVYMSIAFVLMLAARQSVHGQSLPAAYLKLFGTLLPTITVGIVIGELFPLIATLGLLALCFDVFYIRKLHEATSIIR